jgi:hypothetical protein
LIELEYDILLTVMQGRNDKYGFEVIPRSEATWESDFTGLKTLYKQILDSPAIAGSPE